MYYDVLRMAEQNKLHFNHSDTLDQFRNVKSAVIGQEKDPNLTNDYVLKRLIAEAGYTEQAENHG